MYALRVDPYENRFFRFLDRKFMVRNRRSSILQEVIGGTTSFLVCQYILRTNATILGFSGMDSDGQYTATGLISAIGTFVIGLFCNLPLVVSPGMGMNSFLTDYVVGQLGYSWENALGLCFIAGGVMLVISWFSIRRFVMRAIPDELRIGIGVGIGLFLCLLGFIRLKFVEDDPNTFIRFAELTWEAGLGFSAVVVCAILRLRRTRWCFIVAIIWYAVGAAVIRAAHDQDEMPSMRDWEVHRLGKLFFKLSFKFPDWSALHVALSFSFFILFDALASTLTCVQVLLISSSRHGRAMAYDSQLFHRRMITSNQLKKTMVLTSLCTMVSALLGSSPVVVFIESASGIAVGARTGLANMVTVFWFIIALVFRPLMEQIPDEASGAALIFTSLTLFLVMRYLTFEYEWETFPAIFCAIAIPFTFSIHYGFSLGYCLYFIYVLCSSTFLKQYLLNRYGRDDMDIEDVAPRRSITSGPAAKPEDSKTPGTLTRFIGESSTSGRADNVLSGRRTAGQKAPRSFSSIDASTSKADSALLRMAGDYSGTEGSGRDNKKEEVEGEDEDASDSAEAPPPSYQQAMADSHHIISPDGLQENRQHNLTEIPAPDYDDAAPLDGISDVSVRLDAIVVTDGGGGGITPHRGSLAKPRSTSLSTGRKSHTLRGETAAYDRGRETSFENQGRDRGASLRVEETVTGQVVDFAQVAEKPPTVAERDFEEQHFEGVTFGKIVMTLMSITVLMLRFAEQLDD